MGQPRPRRLALVVAPQPGESFASWIDRMATDMALPAGRVADAIGVSNAARATDGRPLLFGVALNASERTAIHIATGVAPATLDVMQLAAYDGTVLDLHDAATAGWTTKARSRPARNAWPSREGYGHCGGGSDSPWSARPTSGCCSTRARPAKWRYGAGPPRTCGYCHAPCWSRR